MEIRRLLKSANFAVSLWTYRFLKLILTHNSTINSGQGVHMAALCLECRMYIAVQRNLHIRMPKDLAKALDICAAADTICRECMAERVKVLLFHARIPQIALKFVLICARLHRSVFPYHIFSVFDAVNYQ